MSEASEARLKLGDMICTYTVLAGLTIQSGMSWWWWVGAFFGGWGINLTMRFAAKWYVGRKLRQLENSFQEFEPVPNLDSWDS